MRVFISRVRFAAIVCSLAWFMATSSAFTAATVGTPTPALAAADDELPESDDAPKKAAKEKTPDDAAASKKVSDEKASDEKAAEGKPADEKAGDSVEKTEESPLDKESYLSWLYRSMGLRYVLVFLAVTFNEIALIVMIVLGLRRNSVCPPQLAKDFEQRLNERRYQEAYELAKQGNSLLAKVLAAGMASLPEGYDEAVEAMQEAGHEQTVRLEQRNGNIALIAQIGPMLGLLATVDGIVHSFSVIAGKEVTPKPSELASGIGIALVNTIVGLTIAVFSIIVYHYARNRLTRLVVETGIVSGRLMKRFSKNRANRSTENA